MNKFTKTGLSLALFGLLLGGVTLLTTHTKTAQAASPAHATSAGETVATETPETASSTDPGNVAGGGHQDLSGSNVDHQFNGVE